MTPAVPGPSVRQERADRGHRHVLVAAIIAFCAALFLVDNWTPRGTAEAVFYVIAVLLSFGLSDRAILVTAATTSALTIAGFFVSPLNPGTPLWLAVLNRLVAFGVIWISALLGRERARALRREQQQARRWETTVSSIGDAVLVTDRSGRITFLNRVAEELTGWTSNEAAGMPLERVFTIINEQTRRPVDNPVSRVLQQGVIVGLANHTVLVRRDGTEVPIDDSAAPIFEGRGELTGVVLVFRDVTGSRRAERQLREGLEMLAEADRLKDTFLAVLAHELRQPLNALRAATSVLRLSATSSETLRPTEVIDRQVLHLARLVDDLTDASHIKRGKVRLALGKVDLREVLTGAAETLKPTLASKAQHLDLALPEEPIPLEADAHRLRQVFSNLLANACSHTPDGGHINLEASLDGSCATVRVRDHGRGIPPHLVPRVFDLFVQGDDAHIGAGMGIGLALVKGFVELHGGHVALKSEGDGQGTEFTVTIPLAARGDTQGERT